MAYTFRRRALIVVLWDAWPAWVSIAGIVVAILAGFQLAANESAGIRYAGAVLQVLGLGTVAIGLSQIRRCFGRPSLLEKTAAWFRQFGAVFLPPKPVTVQGNAGSTAIVGGEARLVVSAGSGASLERRVGILEQNLNRLRDEVDAKENKTKKELNNLKGAIDQEQRDRQTEARQIIGQMEELAVGGLHLEVMGLAWLMLGVLATSIPDEIAKLLSLLRVI